MIGTIIGAVILGTILGALARLILPGKQDISVWVTIAVGIAAALIGGAIAHAMGAHWLLTHLIQLILAIVFVWGAAHMMHRSATNKTA